MHVDVTYWRRAERCQRVLAAAHDTGMFARAARFQHQSTRAAAATATTVPARLNKEPREDEIFNKISSLCSLGGWGGRRVILLESRGVGRPNGHALVQNDQSKNKQERPARGGIC